MCKIVKKPTLRRFEECKYLINFNITIILKNDIFYRSVKFKLLLYREWPIKK